MSQKPGSNAAKSARVIEIQDMIKRFCDAHLDDEMAGYALKLCQTLGRKRKVDILRGKKEIWAAAIVYVIARLNFLFDNERENFITPDTICDFFGTVKSTTGNKASQIEKECTLFVGAEGYCSPEISDMLTFAQTEEGFLIPKGMVGEKEVVVQFVEGAEAAEIERAEEQRRLERKRREKEQRQQKAEQKRAKEREMNQMNLLDDLF